MSTKERKRAQMQVRKRVQKGAKERKRAFLRKSCKRPTLKQPRMGTPQGIGNVGGGSAEPKMCQNQLGNLCVFGLSTPRGLL